MIAKLIAHFKDGIRYTARHSALLATLAVLIVVPAAFLWTGQQFLEVGMDRAERLEKDRIGSLHDAVALVMQAGTDRSRVRQLLETYAADNPDTVGISLYPLEGNTEPLIIASGPTLEAYADHVRVAALRVDESVIFERSFADERHWIGVRAIGNETGVVTHVLLTDTSMAAVDAYLASKVFKAYATLVVVVGIILLVLWRQIRVTAYARMYAELKAAHETMSLFVNMTAHELRTPLTVIKWSANEIKEDQARAAEHALKIEAVTNALIALINDLLDLARIQAGKMTFAHEQVDLADVAVRTVTMLRPLAAERGLALATDISLDRKHSVIADDARLGQSLTNVISNALKYTKTGTITVSLEKAKGRYEIRVKDTGMGISAEDQRRLFAPYFRVASPDVDRTTGTGLGMWITKRMIEEMGGTIDVESIKGVGTHIVISFPTA